MDFSEAWRHTGSYALSPDGLLLAMAVDHRLVVRELEHLQILQVFTCQDKISLLEWASNSVNILSASFAINVVQAWSVAQPDWRCCITESSTAGLVHARWSPDGSQIITTSDFQLRVTIWSIVSSGCVHVDFPKHVSRGLDFSSDGHFMAVATRRQGQDVVSILSCDTWEIVQAFAPETADLVDLKWSPDNSSIAVWDSLLEYKVLIYSPDGRCLAQHQAYAVGLGVKSVAWSPRGHFLAIGSTFDQTIRALNHQTWKVVAELTHPATVKSPPGLSIYKEVQVMREQLDGSDAELWHSSSDPSSGLTGRRGEGSGMQVRYELSATPTSIPNQKPPPDRPNPKQGISILEWSSDGRFLLARCDTMPSSLWVWDMTRLTLSALLVQREQVRAASWDPSAGRLALCTGSSYVYFWSEEGASCVALPYELSNFAVIDLQWSCDGTCLLLKSRDSVCCAFLTEASAMLQVVAKP